MSSAAVREALFESAESRLFHKKGVMDIHLEVALESAESQLFCAADVAGFLLGAVLERAGEQCFHKVEHRREDLLFLHAEPPVDCTLCNTAKAVDALGLLRGADSRSFESKSCTSLDSCHVRHLLS